MHNEQGGRKRGGFPSKKWLLFNIFYHVVEMAQQELRGRGRRDAEISKTHHRL